MRIILYEDKMDFKSKRVFLKKGIYKVIREVPRLGFLVKAGSVMAIIGYGKGVETD